MARIRGSIAALFSAIAFIAGALLTATLYRSRRTSFGEEQAELAPALQSPASAEVKDKRRQKLDIYLRSGYLNGFGSLASLVSLAMSLVMWCGGSPHNNFQPPIIADLQMKARVVAGHEGGRPESPKIDSSHAITSMPQVKGVSARPKASLGDQSRIDVLPGEVHAIQALEDEIGNREPEVEVAQPRVKSEEVIGSPTESSTMGSALIIAEENREFRPVKLVRIGNETVQLDLYPGLCGI